MGVPKTHVSEDGSGDLLSVDFRDHTVGMYREGNLTLRSPFFFFYTLDFVEGGVFPLFAAIAGTGENGGVRAPSLNCACVPVAPGVSRLLLIQSRKKGKDEYLDLLPTALGHLFINRFLDSDLTFLHYQERNLRLLQGGAPGWKGSMYIPAESDRIVSGWRNWLSREGARCVQDGQEGAVPPSPRKREDILDRYTQHTAHCVHCREALELLPKVQLGLVALFSLALILERLILPACLTPWCVAVELLALGAALGLQLLRQEFYFVDYEHYKT